MHYLQSSYASASFLCVKNSLEKTDSAVRLYLGVIIQAAIFGLIHLLMVWGHTGFLSGMVIVLYPMGAAVLFAYINEKLANGSILPGWMVHGLLNALEGLMQLGI